MTDFCNATRSQASPCKNPAPSAQKAGTNYAIIFFLSTPTKTSGSERKITQTGNLIILISILGYKGQDQPSE